jgi:hypothetical protein
MEGVLIRLEKPLKMDTLILGLSVLILGFR